jgi:hypothetical protein
MPEPIATKDDLAALQLLDVELRASINMLVQRWNEVQLRLKTGQATKGPFGADSMHRTYYCVEDFCPTYPVGTILVYTTPQMSARCHKVRASSRREAEQKLRDALNKDRFDALNEIAEEV